MLRSVLALFVHVRAPSAEARSRQVEISGKVASGDQQDMSGIGIEVRKHG